MFPCKQRDNTEAYRNNYDKVFKLGQQLLKEEKEDELCCIKESEDGTKRK